MVNLSLYINKVLFPLFLLLIFANFYYNDDTYEERYLAGHVM